MLSELRLPSILDATLSELAVLSSEGGDKGAVVVLKLVRVANVRQDKLANVLSVFGGVAWEGTDGNPELQLK